MFNFKIWIFNIDFTTILSFIIGIFFGIALLSLIYALLVLMSLRDKKKIIKPKGDIPYNEVNDLIGEAIKEFKDRKIRQNQGRISHCFNISRDLAYSIASRFYPKSKYPLLELSVDEVIMLLGYIQEKVNQILDRKGLRLLKKWKASFILDISRKTAEVLNSKAFQVSKDVSKFASKAKIVLNTINPLNLVRRLIIKNTEIIIINKLCEMVITIVGEETYKIYSKHVFDKNIEIESNVDQIEEELEAELNKTLNMKVETAEDLEKLKLKNYYVALETSSNYKCLLDENMKFKESL